MTSPTPGSLSFVSTAAGKVSVATDGPDDGHAAVVLAPGAGGGMDGAFMRAIAVGLAQKHLLVYRFNFGYTEQGRRSPDKQPLLEQTYRDVLRRVRQSLGARPLFLGGKSMGGRIASHIVADGETPAGLIFLGYPLHPPGRPDRIRDAHLRALKVPMLFVCPLPTLNHAIAKFVAPTNVAVIEDGDHSFKVRKDSGRSTEAAWDEVIEAVAAWIGRRIG
jgi:hypothetical protein